MKTYHIIIKGIVQGVGFRPFVYKLATSLKLKGWVLNSGIGVHIQINEEYDGMLSFINQLKNKAPILSKITAINFEEVTFVKYIDFKIEESFSLETPSLLITPDFGLCEDCREELVSEENNRYHYPFITCTNCGPRYSIISSLPYDRENTTMESFSMCKTCNNEYHDTLNRRYYSQTNSCSNCSIEISYYEKGVLQQNFKDLEYIVEQWKKGKIISIKGIGGYLITCDASNKKTISRLRVLKNRPAKPFALMYPSIDCIKKDAVLTNFDHLELKKTSAPIVILKTKNNQKTKLALKEIAPNLDCIGSMLPYAPLFELLLSKFKNPIIATSGNLSNSSIIYSDSKAIKELSKLSDGILLNNREIAIPQDDSVVKFSSISQQKIVVRRSRGIAPTYINNNIALNDQTIFSSGAMLKSTFSLLNKKNIFISQYLGNTNQYDVEQNYENTFSHFKSLFQPKFDIVLVDKHPNYFSTRFGKELASLKQIPYLEIQHHKAHFLAVIGENNLLYCEDKILGVIWDGTGYGDDGSIWGGEFFIYKEKEINRVAHLEDFQFILGDKMSIEPRISLLSLAYDCCDEEFYKNKFNSTEWNIYKNLLQQKNNLKSSSMGRLFDGVASLLLNIDKQSFEGEAAMQLECLAQGYFNNKPFNKRDSYIKQNYLPPNFRKFLLKQITIDLKNCVQKENIAAKFHVTLVHYIFLNANQQKVKKIAFSGGVFQNQCLLDILHFWMGKEFKLFFHKELSPNDECISFGQLMYYLKDKNS